MCSSLDTFDSFSQFVVDALKQVLVVSVQLGGFTKQFALNPLLVHHDLLAIEVSNRSIDARELGALVEFHS